MNYWEFLIQKEGDDTWLPLESEQVEILEGRYRVVAHTDRVNTQMEIKVSQLVTTEMPPRKRVRKRTGETNESGLVVVMPYVHLKPGQWELKCSSLNLMDDLIGEGWQYQVQLQVFALTDEDWSSEWPVPEDLKTIHSPLSETDTAYTDTPAKGDTPLVTAQAKLQDNLERQGQTDDDIDTSLLDAVFRVSLRQQAFLARRNQSMTIMGQVQALSDALPVQGASQLWLRLQNPETAKVIMEAHRPLSLERLPADFKVKIQLPGNVKTRVVLGEVSLRTAAIDNEPAKVLSSTSFTITAGIAQLIDEIANRDPGTFEEELAVLSGNANESSEPAVSTEPDLVSPILDPTRQTVAPAVGVVLPPKLDRSLSGDVHAAELADQPELPAFPEAESPETELPETETLSQPQMVSEGPANGASSLPPLVSQPAQFMGTSIEDDDLETSQIAALLEDIDGDLASQPADIDSLEPPGVAGVLSDAAIDSPAASLLPADKLTAARNAKQLSSSDSSHAPSNALSRDRAQADQQRDARSQRQSEASLAFKSLKLKDHFWNRLSNLTHESREAASQLAKDMEAAGVSPDSTSGSSRSLPPFQAWDAPLPDNSEVVIYDKPDDKPPVLEPPTEPPTEPATQPPAAYPPENATSSKQPLPNQPLSSHRPLSQSPSSQRLSSQRPSSQRLDAQRDASSASPAATPSSFSRQPAGHQSAQTAQSEDIPEMELPVISVPMGDFVAGDRVTITVRTRPAVYKPFIKLWMIDRQSRTLVGEPKLLTSLVPDALGYLEAHADLMVPMDCLDVQIAAIAIDMATQQESNKAIVNRRVVPANQSSASPRNFNL